MKKITACIVSIAFCLCSAPCWAGSNFFSSSNEQLGILAQYYDNAATYALVDANAAYVCHVLATYSGDSESADADYENYEQYFEKAQTAIENADTCYNNILLSISDPAAASSASALRLDGDAVPHRLNVPLVKKPRLEPVQ